MHDLVKRLRQHAATFGQQGMSDVQRDLNDAADAILNAPQPYAQNEPVVEVPAPPAPPAPPVIEPAPKAKASAKVAASFPDDIDLKL
jgi:hypothetical protein